MTEKYQTIDYLLKSMTELLMKTYEVSFDWALETFLKSETYKRLLNDEELRNEGDLFIFELLQKELTKKGIFTN